MTIKIKKSTLQNALRDEYEFYKEFIHILNTAKACKKIQDVDAVIGGCYLLVQNRFTGHKVKITFHQSKGESKAEADFFKGMNKPRGKDVLVVEKSVDGFHKLLTFTLKALNYQI